MNDLYYIGLDIHKKSITYVMKTDSGELARQGSLPFLRRKAARGSGRIQRGRAMSEC